MDTQILEAVGIDYKQGLLRFSSKKVLYERFLVRFSADPNFEQLQTCMENKDYEKAFQWAHSLKGVTGNLSLNGLYVCCSRLVEALRQNDGELAEQVFLECREKYQLVVVAIEKYFGE